MKKLLGFVVFFGLCWLAYDFSENHKSTTQQREIAELSEKVDFLRSENIDIAGVNRQMGAKLEELGHPWEDEAAEESETAPPVENSDD